MHRLQAAAGNRAVQRLVAVPGGVDLEARRVYDGDNSLLNHIAWALNESGDPLVGFADGRWPAAALPPTATVHVVEHGFPGGLVGGAKRIGGAVQWYESGADGRPKLDHPVVRQDHVQHKSWVRPPGGVEREATGVAVDLEEWDAATLTNKLAAVLPGGFAGRIRITSCDSATPDAANRSLAADVADGLRQGGFPNVRVSGVLGPSVTGDGRLGATRPGREADAVRITGEVRAKHAAALTQFYAWLDAHPNADLASAAREAARLDRGFYAEYFARLAADGVLDASPEHLQP